MDPEDSEEDVDEWRYRLAHPYVKTYAATLLQYLREHGAADETDAVSHLGGGDYCVLCRYYDDDKQGYTRWAVTCTVGAYGIYTELVDGSVPVAWLSLPPDALAAACNELQRLMALMERETIQ